MFCIELSPIRTNDIAAIFKQHSKEVSVRLIQLVDSLDFSLHAVSDQEVEAGDGIDTVELITFIPAAACHFPTGIVKAFF